MSNIPALKPQQVVRILVFGFVEVRQRGSHKQFRHEYGRTTVPFHKGRDISPTLLQKIASDIDLTVKEMLESRSGLTNLAMDERKRLS